MKLAIALLLGLASGVLPSAPCVAQSIQIKTDDGSYALCRLDIPAGESRTWQIVAQRGSLAGIGGAEFRVAGFPAGYVHVVTPNPSAVITLGDPLGAGCNIGFANSCDPAASLLLYTVETFNTGAGQPGTITIEQHSVPSNANYLCPRLENICDPPEPTTACATGATVNVNQGSGTPPADPVPGDLSTAVALNAQLSWTAGHPGSECAVGIPSHRVYIGTSADPPFAGEVGPLDNTVFDPGALQPNTTYHWRIEAIDTGFGITGPVWSFTTGGPVGVESLSWHAVKQLFR